MTSSAPLPATRLVCTIGPASRDRIEELVAAGMSIARLNFAHGTPADHAAAVAAIRAAGAAAGRELAVLADIPGPKVRLGELAGGRAVLEAGAGFTLVAADGGTGAGDARRSVTNHPGLAGDLQPGDHVWLSDGAVELLVEGVTGDEIRTIVLRGGTVRSRAGLGVPAERLSLPALSERDRLLATAAAEAGVDFIGESFVRGPEDVAALRTLVGEAGPGIVAKIETRPAVERFAAIAAASDAVMVARGDLGLELPFEAVPLVQKRLVRLARQLGRPVIVATQMLESMVTAPRPTRAEANAVLDGADAVMLSGETAIGAYPVLAVEAAIRICRAAETGLPASDLDRDPGGLAPDPVTEAATALARDPGVVALVVAGPDGMAAASLAGRRPPVPVIAIVDDPAVARRLVACRGIQPVVPSEPGLAARAADVPADRLVEDPAVAGRVPGTGRIVVLTAPGGTVASRLEVLDAVPAPDRGPAAQS